MLAFLITLFNLLVLLSNLSSGTRLLRKRNPTLLNYSNYVISMAVADLLTGVVVLPLALFFMYQELVYENALVPPSRNLSIAFTDGIMEMAEHSTHIGHFDKKFLHLMNAVGVFSHLAIFTSIYTLAAASADRFYTSCKPVPNGSLKLSSG